MLVLPQCQMSQCCFLWLLNKVCDVMWNERSENKVPTKCLEREESIRMSICPSQTALQLLKRMLTMILVLNNWLYKFVAAVIAEI